MRKDHTATKLLRKVRLSVSVDEEALALLERMAGADRRSVSSELNILILDAAIAKGLKSIDAPPVIQADARSIADAQR